jgi:hypothetical protein
MLQDLASLTRSVVRYGLSRMNVTIYVYLLDEGVDCWRPVSAEHVAHDMYHITGERPDDTETWEFKTGELVRCKPKSLSGDLGSCQNVLWRMKELMPLNSRSTE